MSAYNFGSSGPTLRKLYQVTWLEAAVIKWTLILQGVPPTKFGRAKNVQNSSQFLTTFDFDREYLRKETRYQNSERHVISSDSSRVQPNKSGELWSTIHKGVHVSLDPPKSIFFDRVYFGP